MSSSGGFSKFEKSAFAAGLFLCLVLSAYGFGRLYLKETQPIAKQAEVSQTEASTQPVALAETPELDSPTMETPSASLDSNSTSEPVVMRSEGPRPRTLGSIYRKRQIASESAAASPAEPPVSTDLSPVACTPQSGDSSRPENLLARDFWIWVGMGMNFTTYSQTVPGFSDVNFGRIKGPSQMFRSGFMFADQYGLDLGYKNTPGEAEESETISVTNGAYEWKTLSAELMYLPESESSTPESQWIWRLGFQQHQMPFLVPLTANSISVKENSMTALSFGAEYRKFTKKNLRIEAMLRYQHPLSASSSVATSFTLKPQLTFDGSIGAAYNLSPNVYLGTYWYGQYHQYNFDFSSDGTTFSGSQSLFFSNFDVRLGVEF